MTMMVVWPFKLVWKQPILLSLFVLVMTCMYINSLTLSSLYHQHFEGFNLRFHSLFRSEEDDAVLNCSALVRLGDAYGGWTICSAIESLEGDIVYTIGVGENILWDEEMMSKFGTEHHGWDPTPTAINYFTQRNEPDGFHFHAYGLGVKDGSVTLKLPHGHGASYTVMEYGRKAQKGKIVTVQMLTLQSMMTMMRHQHLAILKIDIEGAEFAVIESWVKQAYKIPADQVLVEFHERYFTHQTSHKLKVTEAIEHMSILGFDLINKAQNGMSVIFRQKDDATKSPTPTTPPDSSNAGGGSNHTHVIIAVAIMVFVGVLGFMFLSMWRRWRSRRRVSGNTRSLAPNADSSSISSSSARQLPRDRPPTPPLPPAIVRMQRHASSAGLSLSELDVVSPINPFNPTYTRTPDDSACPICLDDLETDIKSRRLPCEHTFHAECIEEWVTKANRCPVCNSHVIDHNQLRQYRAAALQGHPPPSLLSTSVTSPTIAVRQRRRRTRGENGTFHLREGDGSLGSITTPTEQQNTFETRPDNELAQPVESSNQRTQSVPLDAVANPDLALASSTSES